MSTRRQNLKNEATGMRLVSQLVQEFWECDWQPFDHRNDEGIDGLIKLKRRGVALGVNINVQVKCGLKYISSYDDSFLKIKFKSEENLNAHIAYWTSQTEAAVLVFVNPERKLDNESSIDTRQRYLDRMNPDAWWVDLKSPTLKDNRAATLIKIPRKQKFTIHSKGDFIKLCHNELKLKGIPEISLRPEFRQIGQIKNTRDFFTQWRASVNGRMHCKALNADVIISNVGWKHISARKRGKERIEYSKRLLGAARQIIEETGYFKLLGRKVIEDGKQKYKIGLLARVSSKTYKSVIQVVLVVWDDLKTQKKKYWFYSVHPIK